MMFVESFLAASVLWIAAGVNHPSLLRLLSLSDFSAIEN